MTAQLIIGGLGPAGLDQITLETWSYLQQADQIILRTEIHPAAQELKARQINFSACDAVYDSGEDFAQIYQDITDIVLRKAQTMPEGTTLLYCVPGHPCVAEDTVQRLLKQAPQKEVPLRVLSAMSFLDPVFTALGIDPTQAGFVVIDALALPEPLPGNCSCLFTQVYSRLIASDLKLSLLEHYPPEQKVKILYHVGITSEQKIREVPLAELDYQGEFDHLTSVFVPGIEVCKAKAACLYPLDPLVEVFDQLLGPEGCPWDREQTHESLKKYLLEEVYEVLEAIDLQDMTLLQEELGDVLMQIVFHGALAKARGDFDYNQIIQGITEKLIRRHPHVFGQAHADEARQVEEIWDQVKAGEAKANNSSQHESGHIYKGLPALMMATQYLKQQKKRFGKVATSKQAKNTMLQSWADFIKGLEENSLDEVKLGELLFDIAMVAKEQNLSCEVALIRYIQNLP
jgi:tetrapyrrole methylase family protein/MazG family protein